MAAYAGYIPVIQTKYLLQGLFSQKKFAEIMASGVLNAQVIDEYIGKGDTLNVPQAIQVDDFFTVDLSSTSAYTGTRVTTNNAKAPILRKFTAMSYTEHDDIRTDENWLEKLALSAGNKLAKDVIVNMHAMFQGVINVGGLNHLHTVSGALGVQDILTAKTLLGDQGDQIDTMLMHPTVYLGFIRDLTNNFKFSGDLAGKWLMDGMIESVFGIRNIVVTQDLAAVAGGSSDASGDQYYTWLLKSNDAQANEADLGGPVYYGYQAQPRFKEFADTRVPSTLFQPGWNTDYCLGVRGMAFNGPSNPAVTDLEIPGNWAQANNDSRNVGLVGIFSQNVPIP